MSDVMKYTEMEYFPRELYFQYFIFK